MGKATGTGRSRLAALEEQCKKLQVALSAAEKEVARRGRELTAAQGQLAIASAVAENGTWFDKRAARKAEAAVEEAQERLSEARVLVKQAAAAIEPVEAQIEDLRIGVVKPEIASARRRAMELKTQLRAQQEQALQTARQLAAIYRVSAEKTPQRLVSMRSDRFVRVEITDPVHVARLVGVDGDGKLKASSATFHVEYFHAVNGEKKKKWRIVPGQDLTDTGKVERIKCDGPLPAEVENIRDIDLGNLISPNGKPPTELERTDLTFNVISAMVSEEELRQAKQAIEEGA